MRKRKTDKEKTPALALNLHREFFDAIVSGKKKREYRDNTEYWRRRLVNRQYAEVHFRNGYATKAPFARVKCLGIRKERFGRGSRFVIRLGRILEIANY